MHPCGQSQHTRYFEMCKIFHGVNDECPRSCHPSHTPTVILRSRRISPFATGRFRKPGFFDSARNIDEEARPRMRETFRLRLRSEFRGSGVVFASPAVGRARIESAYESGWTKDGGMATRSIDLN